MADQGQVGPQVLSSGVQANVRLDATGSICVSESRGRFTEQAYRGNIYFLDSDSVTLAAANATKGAMATIKLVNGFFNPLNSGKLACILRAHVATTSGTPAGAYFYNYISGLNMTNTVTGTAKPSYLGTSATSAMLGAVNVVLTATGGPTTALNQLGVLGGPAAIAAGAGLYDAIDEVGGCIIVPPGTIFGIAALGAGTSHIVQSTLVWEEIPI